jgi:hypothetical protein
MQQPLSWFIFLNAHAEEEISMVTEGKPAVQKTLHSLQMMSLDEETRRLITRQAVPPLDHNTTVLAFQRSLPL